MRDTGNNGREPFEVKRQKADLRYPTSNEMQKKADVVMERRLHARHRTASSGCHHSMQCVMRGATAFDTLGSWLSQDT